MMIMTTLILAMMVVVAVTIDNYPSKSRGISPDT